jgi:hypothetical protein
MFAKETSGAQQSDSPTTMRPGTAPGGASYGGTPETTDKAVLPHRYSLQFLLALIARKSNRQNSSQLNE